MPPTPRWPTPQIPDGSHYHSLCQEPALSSSTKEPWSPQCPTTFSQMINANSPPLNHDERPTPWSSLPTECPMWFEDLPPPLSPPPHTYGRPIALPPVDDDDYEFFWPVDDADLAAWSHTNAPIGSPHPTQVRRNNDPVDPSSRSSNRQAFSDCDIMFSLDSHACYDGGSVDLGFPGSDRRRVEEWRHNVC